MNGCVASRNSWLAGGSRTFGRIAPQALRALAWTTLIAGAVPAAAAEVSGVSVGLGGGADFGRTDCVSAYACEHHSGYVDLFGATRVADAVDVRADLFYAGSFKGGDTTPLGTQFGGRFDVYGVGLTAGYHWDFAQVWRASVRAGAAAVHTRFDYSSPFGGSVNKTTLEPLAGAGVSYALTPQVRLGVDYDVTRFKVYQSHGLLQMFGVSAQYSF